MNSTRRTPKSSASAAANALRRIVRAIRVSSHRAEETFGISGAQLFVLQQLEGQPAASLGELASRTLTDVSSVSVVVSRLVQRQLVARRASAKDGRRIELSLTARGRAILLEAPESVQARLVAALRGLRASELATFTRVVDRLARDMGADAAPPTMFFEPEADAPARGRSRSSKGSRS